jgi:DSF synthase
LQTQALKRRGAAMTIVQKMTNPTVETASSGVSEDILGAIRAVAGPLPQIDLEYEAKIRLLWITLKPEPKPVFTVPIISSVRKVQDAVMRLWSDAQEPPVLFLAYRGVGPVFSLGGDLDFYLDCLAKNDRAGLLSYAKLATDVIGLNTNGLKGMVITLSTIHGKALGGGIDPARACNVLVAEDRATFGYPEINYNHFPISAVPILSRHTGLIEAERILTLGLDYTAVEFLARGVLDAVVPNGGGEDWIRGYATRNLPTHRARVALIAEFNRRAGDLQAELAEAVEIWVNHFMKLKPLEISKLQRVAQIQERMLSRLSRSEATETKQPTEGVS